MEEERWKAIVIGSALGDGSLTPVSKRKGEAMLHVGYHDRLLEYLQWMHRELAVLGVNPIQPKRGFQQHHFYTKPHRELGQLREVFYPQGHKVVPQQIGDLLIDPLSLAVWYMDDGSLDCRWKNHFNATISTHSFSREGCELLRTVLWSNFGVKAAVHQSTIRGKTYYRLYFLAESMERFLQLVTPQVLPCLGHKVIRSGQQPR